jgi:hypothetical protein
MMDNKEASTLIYAKYLHLASQDGRLFRKTVMEEIMATMGVTVASAATYYNNCKKAAPVEGLGRPTVTKGARKVTVGKAGKAQDIIPDNECFTVLEIVGGCVGRTQAFVLQGEASEAFDGRVRTWPRSEWILIQGLGPNAGDTYKLETDEKEIKGYNPNQVDETPVTC